MNLTGKSREQIGRALRERSRAELLDLIFSLSTVEELFKPSEIAKRSKINRRDVLRDIKAGKFGGGYFCRAQNSLAVSASSVNKWRRSFFVPVNRGPTNGK
jgi:hypothetical protein